LVVVLAAVAMVVAVAVQMILRLRELELQDKEEMADLVQAPIFQAVEAELEL
jgi:hypothetical protein